MQHSDGAHEFITSAASLGLAAPPGGALYAAPAAASAAAAAARPPLDRGSLVTHSKGVALFLSEAPASSTGYKGVRAAKNGRFEARLRQVPAHPNPLHGARVQRSVTASSRSGGARAPRRSPGAPGARAPAAHPRPRAHPPAPPCRRAKT